MGRVPFISVLIVNYNGRDLLDACLHSVFSGSYPREKYEVIVVDNNSSDDSVPYLLKHFPQVNVIENSENGGFTGGNNLGFSHAKGEYIVLLNSDVVVDSQWLHELVNSARDEQVGIVCSKLRYALPFVELVIDSGAVPKSQVFHTVDHSPIGVLVENIICDPVSNGELVIYKDGFYDKKDGEITTRRTSGKSRVFVPFDSSRESNTFILTLHGLDTSESMDMPVKLYVNGHLHTELTMHSHEAVQVPLHISTQQVSSHFIWLVQNAGNIILANGYGKDRGSVIELRENERNEHYEIESSYYDQPVDLLGACGASFLIKRAVIDHVGFLDGNYFMYYEDMEMSVRAWRAGWKIRYAPASIGYHKHRATTGSEETSFFLYLVERNHLAFVVTHFPLRTVVIEMILFLSRYAMTTLKCIAFKFRDNELRARIWQQKYEGRKMAFVYLIRSAWRLWRSRQNMNSYWPMNYTKLEKLLY